MRYFDGEIKHLDGFKYNNGERVKYFIIVDDEENDTLIRHGNCYRRASQVNPGDPYDSFNMSSSFYNTVFFFDERCAGPDVKLKKKLDIERVLCEGTRSEWDD